MELIDKWKVQDALEMYGVRHWGKGYFSINERGHVTVHPDKRPERGIDLIDYPNYMLALNALPPAPSVFGEGWRAEWKRRLQANRPWLEQWLAHPTHDDWWKAKAAKLTSDVPLMLYAGLADKYATSVLRIAEQWRDEPWEAVEAEAAVAHAGLRAEAEAMSDEQHHPSVSPVPAEIGGIGDRDGDATGGIHGRRCAPVQRARI